MRIGEIDLDEKVLVVAEVGNNHEGSFEVAKELVRRAAECRVDAVKFQTFRTEHYVSSADKARFNRLKSFELSYSQFEELSRFAHSLGLLFISTPLDLKSAEALEPMVDCYKVASGDINFYPLITCVARTGRPMIISTGASDFEQAARTVDFIRQQMSFDYVKEHLAVLHCVSNYPTAPEDASLLAIRFLAERLDCTVGYSDHTIGAEATLMAVALGARIVEKHFTLNKNFSDFRDHQISADPEEMRELAQKIRLASTMLGRFEKKTRSSEEQVMKSIRRSIVAAADLPEGHSIDFGDLTWIRPAGGLGPGEEGLLVGKTLRRNVRFGEQILVSDVK